MPRWLRWSAGALAVVLVATGAASWLAGEDPGMPGFRLAATTDADTYARGEAVELTVRVCRTRPWPVRTTSGGGTNVRVTWQVVDGTGEVVADTSHRVYTSELLSVLWLPGQCRSVEDAWDQHHWSHPLLQEEDDEVEVIGVPVVGDRGTPGRYRFEVTWETTPYGEEARSSQPASPVPSAPFELLP